MAIVITHSNPGGQMNLASHLERWAAERPSHPAILFEGRRLSYADLDAAASRLAHALRANGVSTGDRVALYLPNVPEFAIVFFAAQKLGAITVSINAIFRAAEVEYLLNDSGAKAVFTVGELAQFVPRERCPELAHVVVCEGEAPAGAASLADWCAGRDARFESVDCVADAPASLLYSSGTTGFPKGVTLTQSNISTNIATAAKCSGYRADDRLAVFLPLFHVYGQNYIMN
ncbi:MAG: long-chain fatty acid--CoA ligase, partial [Burkholderiales bacterium]